MSDLLLYAVSTLGSMDISRFYMILNEIIRITRVRVPEELNLSYSRMQTLRFLDALGHCDYDYENHSISACPPNIVLLPHHGVPKVVLTVAAPV
jgi:hypothetical protein